MHNLVSQSYKILGLGLILILLTPATKAIPAFSRKYQTSCATCHVAFPVLSSHGQAFKANGYRFARDEEDVVKEKPVSLGAPAWKQMFPNSVWPSDMPGASVASFWLSSRFQSNPSSPIASEFDGLNELYLLGAGTLGESLSFFAEVEIIDGGTIPVGFGDGVPRAFLQYNHSSRKFNLTYGLFEPRAVLASSRLRLMRINDYLANYYGMPTTGNSFSLGPNQRGFEVWGNWNGPAQKGGLEWFAGMVNGRNSGIPRGTEALPQHIQEFNLRLQAALNREGRTDYENNSNKDFYFGANYKIGGEGRTGTSQNNAEGSERRDQVENFVTVGGFFYRGIAPTLIGEAGEEILVRDGTSFQRVGAKVEINLDKANILGGVQLNRDQIRDQSDQQEAVIAMVEARYQIYPWLIPALRFENLNPNFGAAFNRTTIHGSVLARANVRLSVEGVLSRNSTDDPIRDYRRYDTNNDSRFQVRLDFAY